MSKLTILEQCEMIEHCGELLDKGYAIQQVIETLALYYGKKREKLFKNILLHLYEGKTFHESLKENHFSLLLCEYIYFAERNGELSSGCKNAGTSIKKLIKKIKELRNKFIYPFLLLCFVFILFLFIQSSIYPNFEQLYDQNIFTSSSSNKILSIIPSIIFKILAAIVVVILLFFLFLFYFYKYKSMYRLIKKITRVPLLGQVCKYYVTYYFSYQLKSFLQAGISLQNSLKVFQEANNTSWLKENSVFLEKELLKGNDFAKAVQLSNLFLDELAKSISLGNRNGKLVMELEEISNYCFSKLEQGLQRFISILQPSLFIIIGLVIVCLYLSILLPIFQLMEGF